MTVSLAAGFASRGYPMQNLGREGVFGVRLADFGVRPTV